MSYVALENFKAGLDTRRSNLTSLQGVLEDLQNAFINQGGEVEKRKAFVEYANIPTDIETFGFERLKTTLVIFGGDDGSGVSWPTGVTYQRLIRTAIVGNPSSQATAVLSSTVFNNKTVAVAKLADGTTCLFYDGVFVGDWVYGRVLSTTKDNLTDMLAEAINATDYTGTSTTDDTITAVAPAGGKVSASVTEDGVGSLTSVLTDRDATPTTPGKQAQAEFQIFGGLDLAGVQFTTIKVSTVDLLDTNPIEYNTDNETTATDIATRINAVTTTPNYTATAVGPVVQVFAEAVGVAANGLTLEIAVAGPIALSSQKISFGGTDFTVNHIKIDGNNALSEAIRYTSGDSLETFVQRMQDAVYITNSSHEYVAIADGPSLLFTKKITKCTDKAVGIDIKITPTTIDVDTGFAVPGPISEFRLIMSPESMALPETVDLGLSAGLPRNFITPVNFRDVGPASVVAVGGEAPYTYEWSAEFSTPSTLVLKLLQPRETSTWVNYFRYVAAYTPRAAANHAGGTGRIKLKVVDSKGAVALGEIPLLFP